ncbi:PIR Superfamily Protein [Plasmodium ovale wallikeri]|uniref:PIR Superfamily Protein n=1 Tax=Plasmodium ovale wallikeri TaxID=864142 RepID=A0A1A9AMA9_PLAOA|nr:PIR Superfamily Protein [Plasmodium ovale wallikeri]SBT57767.1 PIR Superfamily Protein [Plasmodium ovale wallikeri]
MEFENIDKLESSLQHLPSYKVYKTFKDLDNVDYCNKHFTALLKLQKDGNNITEFCNNIGGIIKHMYEQKENYIKDHCAYFNFYLYDQINAKFSSSTVRIDDILWEFYEGWNKIRTSLLKDKCSFKYSLHNIDLNKWKNMKCIHDYAKNYEYINENYSTNIEKCKKYTVYLNYVIPMYERIKTECCNFGDNCAFYFFYCEHIKNPSELLKKLKCDDNYSVALHSQASQDEAEVEGFSHGTLPKDKEKTELDDESSTIQPLKISMSIISPSIGILLIFFFLCKFSPLGPWLRSIMREKINIRHSHEKEDTDNSLAYAAGNYDIYAHNIPYNISYQHI